MPGQIETKRIIMSVKDETVTLFLRVPPELMKSIREAAEKYDPKRPKRSMTPMIIELLERTYSKKAKKFRKAARPDSKEPRRADASEGKAFEEWSPDEYYE
jgi:hypothetical protein